MTNYVPFNNDMYAYDYTWSNIISVYELWKYYHLPNYKHILKLSSIMWEFQGKEKGK